MPKKRFSTMRYWLLGAVIVAVVFVILAMRLYGPQQSVVKQLQGVEVRDYNGTRLDSVNDFRENSIKGVQHIDIGSYTLNITGLVEHPKAYTYDEVIAHQNYKKVVQLNCVEGWSATILWQGILLRDLFAEANPLPAAKVVIFHAYDGYTVTYPVEYFNGDIIMAYKMNDVTVPPERGYPFVLVAEDRWGYKWIKWITEIEFSDDVNYKGYWESRGYSKEGSLNQSFLG